MKRVKKLLYGIEDYARDRLNQGANYVKGAVNEGIESVQGAFNQGADYIQGLLGGNQQSGQSTPASVQMAQKPTSAPAQVQTPTVTQPTNPTVTQPTGVNPLEANANATKPLTQVDIARNQMEQARQKVYDVLNTKFQYNAKASPLYSILDRQYEEQARKAAGEAYARSVANTGGYGSSYATNTASEARRQVMEGFNDQQYALYQAAKDEFLTERQSAVDWYNMSKQIYSDVKDEALMSAYESAYNVWDGTNDDAVRAALTEQGVSATNINKIMTALKQEKLSNLQTDSSISELQDDAAYKSAYRSASALWTGDNESEVRTALLASGVDAGTISSIIRELKTGTRDDLTLDAELEGLKQSTAYRTAEATARSIWASNKSEAEVRSALSGYSATIVDAIVQQLKQEQLSGAVTDEQMTELQNTQAYRTAEATARSIWASNKSEAAVRSALSGYSATIVDALVQQLKSEDYADKELGYNSDVLDYNSDVLDYNIEELKQTQAYKTAESTARSIWATNKSESAVRSALSGYSATIVDALVQQLKSEDYADKELGYNSDVLDYNIEELRKSVEAGRKKEEYNNLLNTAYTLLFSGMSLDELQSNLTGDGQAIAAVMNDVKSYVAQQGSLDASISDQQYTAAYNAAKTQAASLWAEGKSAKEIEADLQTRNVPADIVQQVLSEQLGYQVDKTQKEAVLKQFADDADATNAYNAIYDKWNSPADTDACVAKLQAQGYDGVTINKVLKAMKADYYTNLETDAAIRDLTNNQDMLDAYNAALTVWSTNQDEAAVRDALSTYSPSIVEDVVNLLNNSALQSAETKAALQELATNDSLRKAYNEAFAVWQNGNDEAAVREALKGYEAVIVEDTISMLKSGTLANMQTDAAIEDIRDSSAYKAAVETANTLKNSGKTLDEIKTELSKTYRSTMVNQIITDLKAAANTDKALDVENKGLDVESEQLDATLEEGRKNREYKTILDTAYGLLFSGTSLDELQSKLTGDSQAIAAVMNDVKAYVTQQGSMDAMLADQQYNAAYRSATTAAAQMLVDGKSLDEISAELSQIVPADIVQQVLSEQLGYQVDKTQKEAVLKQFADDQAATDAYNAIYDKWQSPADTDASVAELQAQGYDGITINKVLKAMKADYYTNLEIDAAIRDLVNDQNLLDAYNAALTVWNTNQDEAAVRDALSAYSPAIVEDVVSLLNNSALQSAETKAALEELATNDALRKAYNEAFAVWQNGNDEAAVREALKGYEAVIVEDTVSMLKAGKLSNMQIDAQIKELERTESGELTEEAERDLYNSAAEIYTGQNKDQVEALLKNEGASDEETAKIINSLEAVEKAGLSDAVKNVTDIASAVDFKAQLDAARRNDTLSVDEYDEQVKLNSGKIVSGINENINDMESIDYEGLGISEDEWNKMDDVDKKLAVFDAVGQMAKEGVVTRSDYYKMLYNDTKEYFASEDYKKSTTKTRDALDRALIIQDLYDAGNLLEDDYKNLLYNDIAPKMEGTTLFESLVKGVKAVNKWGGFDGDWMDNNLAWSQISAVISQGGTSDDRQWAQMSDDQKEMAVIMARHIANRGESTTNKPTTPSPSLASSPTTRTTLDS